MSTRTWVSAVAAIGAGAALSIAGPALPAVGDSSPPGAFLEVEIGDSGTLIAKGAGVVIPVDVTCPAGTTGFLGVSITQTRGRFIASGGGGEEVACTGETQTVSVTVFAQGGAFKRGTALVDAHLSSCTDFFGRCSTAEDTEVISLTTAR
jgi:hypothetical protein